MDKKRPLARWKWKIYSFTILYDKRIKIHISQYIKECEDVK